MNLQVLVALFGLSAYVATAQTFLDEDFNSSDWEAVRIGEPNESGTFSFRQALSGGNPGAFQELTMDYVSNNIVVAMLPRAAVWSPAVQGPVLGIFLAFEARYVERVDSAGIGFTAVLVQNGVYYVGDSGYLPATDQWTGRSPIFPIFGGGADAWVPRDGTLGHPDFSTNAPPIRIGYVANTFFGPMGAHAASGLDNFVAYVEGAPAPRLSISQLANDQIQLTWPTNHFGYGLFVANGMPVPGPWFVPVTDDVSVLGDQFSVILPAVERQQMFQLRKICWVPGYCGEP